MKQTSWQEALLQEVKKAKGPFFEAHFKTKILPNITADFYGMLKSAKTGQIIREEYHLDDGSLSIKLEGWGADAVNVVSVKWENSWQKIFET